MYAWKKMNSVTHKEFFPLTLDFVHGGIKKYLDSDEFGVKKKKGVEIPWYYARKYLKLESCRRTLIAHYNWQTVFRLCANEQYKQQIIEFEKKIKLLKNTTQSDENILSHYTEEVNSLHSLIKQNEDYVKAYIRKRLRNCAFDDNIEFR